VITLNNFQKIDLQGMPWFFNPAKLQFCHAKTARRTILPLHNEIHTTSYPVCVKRQARQTMFPPQHESLPWRHNTGSLQDIVINDDIPGFFPSKSALVHVYNNIKVAY
jgi:hypothetical protein